MRVGWRPAPPKIDMIKIVEKRNAIGGFIALVKEVPSRPKIKPAIVRIIRNIPVNNPTFVIAYSMDSTIKIIIPWRRTIPAPFNPGPAMAFDLA